MKFVTDGELSDPKVNARFAGQSAPIADLRRRRRTQTGVLMSLMVFTWIALIAYIWFYLVPLIPSDRHALVPTWMAVQVIGFLIVTLLLSVGVIFVGRWSVRGGWSPAKKTSGA